MKRINEYAGFIAIILVAKIYILLSAFATTYLYDTGRTKTGAQNLFSTLNDMTVISVLLLAITSEIVYDKFIQPRIPAIKEWAKNKIRNKK